MKFKDILKIKGHEWKDLSDESKSELVNAAFKYWRKRGFPNYDLNEGDILKEYKRLARTDKNSIILENEIQMSMVGLKLANYFHPQMWSVKVGNYRSPFECFHDDECLKASMYKALAIWPNRYSVNESCMRRILKTFKNNAGVSNFRPTVAKALYEEFSTKGDAVLDFSAGYGGRLLGCMPLERTYIGIDPCEEQINGLTNMVAVFKDLDLGNTKTHLYHDCAEEIMSDFEAHSVDLIFSSPPYFNKERYSSNPEQSCIKFPSYQMWLEGFMEKIISESYRILKPKGYFIINIADINGYPINKDTDNICKKYFRHYTSYRMRMGNIPYKRNNNEAYKYEPILVFQKE